MTSQGNAIVLLSGGLDSSTALAIAANEGFTTHALSFNYGQRHLVELEAARRIAGHFHVKEHLVIDVDMRRIGGSALTAEIAVPKGQCGVGDAVPVTYVPARNTVFLSFALAWAEVMGCGHIFIGVNALDYSGYPDCRPEYIEAFERLANLATREGVEGRVSYRLHTPLIAMTKAQIIARGTELGVPYELTHSCYDPAPDGRSCGACDSCALRLKGFREAGLRDPVGYVRS